MRVATTESYLQDKMHRLRQRLSDDYGADPKQLDVITEYLTADKKKGLTAYASQLHKEWNTLGDRAAQLVSYVQVPEGKREKAVELVKDYMTCFVSVVQPGD